MGAQKQIGQWCRPDPNSYSWPEWHYSSHLDLPKIAVTDLSIPIGLSGVLLGIRGKKSLYSELHTSLHQPHTRYCAGQLFLPVPMQIRIVHLHMLENICKVFPERNLYQCYRLWIVETVASSKMSTD